MNARPNRWFPSAWAALILPLCGFAMLSLPAQRPLAPWAVLPAEDQQAANNLRPVEAKLRRASALGTDGAWVARLGQPGGVTNAIAALSPALAAQEAATWPQLAEEYDRILLDDGDALVTLPGLGPPWSAATTSLQVRRLCHLRLASLPRSALSAYRARVDPEARRLLERGEKERSAEPLYRLVDEMFCSTHADRALDLLGDLAFERGDFDEARHWWSLPSPAHEGTLRYPDPRVDTARVRAKQILALAFEGRLDDAAAELSRFRAAHPSAGGWLAGREGAFAGTLDQVLAQLGKEALVNNDEAWGTFAGSPSRDRVLTVCPAPRLWEDGPAWVVRLPAARGPARRPLGNPARFAMFHPVIAGGRVLLADADSVTGYDLRDGKELFRHEPRRPAAAEEAGEGASPRYTLTVEGLRAYARLGTVPLAPATREREEPAESDSLLICLDLGERDPPQAPRERWRVRPPGDETTAGWFEGAPVVRNGRAYVAVSRLAGRRVVTALACYDPLGRLRWLRDVCDAPEFEESATPRHRQHLLTWAGGQLVYCSHSGAVVAADPWTGQPLWAVRYPSRGPLTRDRTASPRDLAPCAYGEGRVFVAPADSDRLFCLDALTGCVLWEYDGPEGIHLLGVTGGRLLFTTRHGVQALDAATGRNEWAQPAHGNLPALGRGLIAGDKLLWPTQDSRLPVRALALHQGRPWADPTQLRHLPPGNFALGEGCLVVAGADELTAFVPPERSVVPPPPVAARRGPIAKPQAAAGGSDRP